MSTTHSPGFARLTGIAFAVAFLGGLATGGEPPEADAPTDEVVRYFEDNASALRVSSFVAVVAAAALVLFGSQLRALLRRGPADWSAGLGAVVTAGTALYATGLAVFAVCGGALADASDLGDETVLRALLVLDANSFFVLMTGMTVVLLASGLRTIRSGALPRWLAVVTIVLGVLAPAGPGGFVAFAAFPFWVVAVAVLGRSATADAVATSDRLVAARP